MTSAIYLVETVIIPSRQAKAGNDVVDGIHAGVRQIFKTFHISQFVPDSVYQVQVICRIRPRTTRVIVYLDILYMVTVKVLADDIVVRAIK